MNRALLKQDAKEAMRSANPSPVLTTLAFFAISLAFTFFANIFTLIQAFSGKSGSDGFIGWLVYAVITILFSLLLGCIQFGYYVYSLKVFKKQDPGITELFSHFPMLLKVLGLSLYMSILVWLWSLLLFIPGIIAALRYSQAFFVLAENPDWSAGDCIRESKKLMKGHLVEYIFLLLSFFFWGLLTLITFGLASLYVLPYMQVTFAGYYLSLKPAESYYDPNWN